MANPRLLGVILCYNDGDVLPDVIEHLLENDHHVVAWNHGSTDDTADVLARYRPHLREVTDISRDVDFYDMYPLMSKHLLKNYVAHYDWISWPDQDEILEGPVRGRSYRESLEEVIASRHSWIEFRDFVYWFTDQDDAAIRSPSARVRHYSLAEHGVMKVRSWRASATNVRWFNHNKAEGSKWPPLFNLRHYPMRSAQQMERRLSRDRADIQHGPVNYHYEHMKSVADRMRVPASALHYDDGVRDLDPSMKFEWKGIYGTRPTLPESINGAYVLSTKRWEIAEVAVRALRHWRRSHPMGLTHERFDRWMATLDGRIENPVLLSLKADTAEILTPGLATRWMRDRASVEPELAPRPLRQISVDLDGVRAQVEADAMSRTVRVALEDHQGPGTPLLALIPSHGTTAARVEAPADGRAEFRELSGGYYFLIAGPAA